MQMPTYCDANYTDQAMNTSWHQRPCHLENMRVVAMLQGDIAVRLRTLKVSTVAIEAHVCSP